MEYTAEFGSLFPVKFLNHSQVKMYDDNDKEIEIPKCDKCQTFKSPIIGKHACGWICWECECE